MARRRIAQEDLIARPEPRTSAALTAIAAPLEWTEIDRTLASCPASGRGEPGRPPLALFRALLLATWHDLSDMQLAAALDDRSILAAHAPTPDASARSASAGS